MADHVVGARGPTLTFLDRTLPPRRTGVRLEVLPQLPARPRLVCATRTMERALMPIAVLAASLSAAPEPMVKQEELKAYAGMREDGNVSSQSGYGQGYRSR